MHKDILFLVLAFKLRYITLDEFAQIGTSWRESGVPNIFKLLLMRLSLGEFNTLRELLLSTLKEHNQDCERAIRSKGGMGIVLKHFGPWHSLRRRSPEETWSVETIVESDIDLQSMKESLLEETLDFEEQTVLEEPEDKTVDFSMSGAPPVFPSPIQDAEDLFDLTRDRITDPRVSISSPPPPMDDEEEDITALALKGSGSPAPSGAPRAELFTKTRDLSGGAVRRTPSPGDSSPTIRPPSAAAQGEILLEENFSKILEEIDDNIDLSVPEQELLQVRPAPPPPPPPASAPRPTNGFVSRSVPIDSLGISREEKGRYRLYGEKYRGSIGRILIGTDTHVGREIALKELLPEQGGTQDPTPQKGKMILRNSANIRFLREARLAGQLQHPSIIPIYEIGEREAGSLYYTMRHVKGRTLGEAISQAKKLTERLKLLPHFIDLCNAIAYAHSQGVIHRDIKPDNVMIGEFGETVVLDWGLAKVQTGEDYGKEQLQEQIQRCTQGNVHTLAGQALGTPTYMPPEQARGAVSEMDQQSDVYSLGAVLYELLVGSPIWSGSVYDVLHKVLQEPPPDVAKIQPEAPKGLVRIAQKALQKEKRHRYRTVDEMRQELELYMAGKSSRGSFSLKSLRALVLHNRVLFAVGVVVLVLLGGLLIALSLSKKSESTKGRELQRQIMTAKRERYESHLLMAQAFDEISQRMEGEGRYMAAKIFAAASLKHNPANDQGAWFRKGFFRSHPEAIRLKTASLSRIYRISFTLSLQLEGIHRLNSSLVKLAVSPIKDLAAIGCYDNTIRLVGLKTKKPPQLLRGHQDRISGLAFSPDGTQLVSGGYDKRVVIWDAVRGIQLHKLTGPTERILDVAWSPQGGLVASLDYQGQVLLWNTQSGQRVKQLSLKRGRLFTLTFSRDGKLLVLGGESSNVLTVDVASGLVKRSIKGFFRRVNALLVTPDNKHVIASGDSNTVVMWNLQSGKIVHSMQGHSASVLDLAVSQDGRHLFSGGLDNTIRVWDLRSGELLNSLTAHKERVYGVATLSDNVRLVTGSWDNTVKVWRVRRTLLLPKLSGHSDYIVQAAFSPDGEHIASSSWDRSVRIWDSKEGRNTVLFRGFGDRVWGVAWSPDGKTLASSCWDGTITLLDTQSGAVIKVLQGHKDRVYGITWTPDGVHLVSSSKDNTTIIWDVTYGKPLHILKGHTDTVRNVAVSPKGKLLATCSKDSTVRLWSMAGERLRTLKGHRDLVSGIHFSSKGNLLASSSKDKRVILWDVATGKPIREFLGHEAWVNQVTFSRDDTYLVTASDDHTVRVWEVSTGKLLLVLHSQKESITASFSPDGKRLIYGDGDDVRSVPLDFSISKKPPQEIISAAERESGLSHEGFRLNVVEPGRLLY